ncbi:MAG: DNA polymerase III subunit psi [Candidatus Oceanisphaera merdipullorum]|nr:DNA polymerase III subunit psi [Candidatus Oceanisphaera merdipullorum]
MTPTQSQLWQFLGLPQWQCAHPERLPLAPVPAAPRPEVLLVLGKGAAPSGCFISDLLTALSLTSSQLHTLSQADWLNKNKPNAPVMLGLNVDGELDAFHWHASLPLSAPQKRALWSCLCRCYLEH